MRKQKKIITVVIFVIALFIMYNIIWFGWREKKYNLYVKNMETFIEQVSYVHTDEEGYLYNVKKPDYLCYTGNLCVASPNGEEALLIWPRVFGGYKYGLQVEKDNEVYSIMLNKDLEAEDVEAEELVEENREAITTLNAKAVKMWSTENH